MYRIKYNYSTGDSFGSYPNNIDYIEITWATIETARENLKRIEEHYQQYMQLESVISSKAECEQILESNKDKDWFVINPESLLSDSSKYYLRLYTDNCKPFQLLPDWIGYFQCLNSAEIVGDIEDSSDKIEF